MVSARNNVAIAAAIARAVLSRVRWLAAVGALGCAMTSLPSRRVPKSRRGSIVSAKGRGPRPSRNTPSC